MSASAREVIRVLKPESLQEPSETLRRRAGRKNEGCHLASLSMWRSFKEAYWPAGHCAFSPGYQNRRFWAFLQAVEGPDVETSYTRERNAMWMGDLRLHDTWIEGQSVYVICSNRNDARRFSVCTYSIFRRA